MYKFGGDSVSASASALGRNAGVETYAELDREADAEAEAEEKRTDFVTGEKIFVCGDVSVISSETQFEEKFGDEEVEHGSILFNY